MMKSLVRVVVALGSILGSGVFAMIVAAFLIGFFDLDTVNECTWAVIGSLLGVVGLVAWFLPEIIRIVMND